MSIIADLVCPLGEEEFRANHFERAPLHNPNACFQPFFNPRDLDALIQSVAETQPERLRANMGGTVLVPPRYSSSVDLCVWAREAYAGGATLVINYIEAFDLGCRRFSQSLGTAFDARVMLTLFATPSGSQGFSPHFDTLDVFVLQIEGSKIWHLGEAAIELPTQRQGYLVNYGSTPNARQRFDLFAGQVLYIPRGQVHWAYASAEPSLHITAEICKVTAGDLLSAAVRHPELLASPEQMRQAAKQRLVHLRARSAESLAPLVNTLPVGPGLFAELNEKAKNQKWHVR